MAYYDKLRAEVPPSLVELLRIPGLGPKTVRQLWTELGIETDGGPAPAAEAGRCARLKGLSARTEQLVLEGIDRLEPRPDRLLLHRAAAIVDGLLDALADTARRHQRRAGRLVPAAQGDDRRPRPPRRDDATARASSSGSRPSASSTRSSTRAATRPRSGCCAGRRST